MQPLLERLWRIARRSRAALVASRTGSVVAMAVFAVIFTILLDAIFRWPVAIRWIVLAALIAAAAIAWRRRLKPALAFRPTPIDVALRIERDHASLRGRLASAVDLHLSGIDRVDPFSASAVSAIASSVDANKLDMRLRIEPIRRALALGIGSLLVAASALALWPEPSRTGLARTFMPWSDASWPARTEVASLMDAVDVAARGRPFSLAASLDLGDPTRERVRAVFRLERDGVLGEWEEIVLTRQSGRRFERRVPSEGDAIEFVFESADDATDPQRIEFVVPPEVETASLHIEPPAYASSVRSPQRFELGPGTDRRSELSAPQLAGSTASLRLELSKPLPVPDASMLGEVLVGAPTDATLSVDPENPSTWELTWRLERPVAVECRLRDEHGLESTAGATYRVGVVDDAPPSIAIVVPEIDEAMLPTAVVSVEAEARDDLEVIEAGLESSIDGSTWVPVDDEPGDRGERRTVRGTVSIESIGAAAGDVVEVVAFAVDGLPGREMVRSSPRRLSIVGEEEFDRRIRDDFAALRQLAIRADGEQSELLEAIERAEQAGDVADASVLRLRQAAVSRRVGRIAEGVGELSQRLRRNRLDDGRQQALAETVTRRAEAAGRASSDAEQAWRRAAEENADPTNESADSSNVEGDRAPDESTSDSDPSTSASSEVASQARSDARQQGTRVRRELEGLVASLDRDEDTWALERELDRLAQDLEELAGDAEAFGRETIGQMPEEMSDDDRRAHGELMRRQDEIGDAASRLMSDLDERSRRLEDRDLGQAEALRQAAETGRQADLERNLEQAEESLERNRTDRASESQRRAAQALQEMGRRLEDTRKVRTETLRRLMTELAESIEALLSFSEEEALALRSLLAEGAPWSGNAISVRSERSIRLERNTRSVAATAKAGGAESEPVSAALERAAGSQGEAIVALRDGVPRVSDASLSMERSSGMLREALELSRRIGDDAEREAQREQRRELAEDYRRLATLQEEIADETLLLAGRLDRGEIARRRRLLETRRQSARQEEVVASSREIADGIEGLSDTAVFAGGHDWIDRWSAEATELLVRGEAGFEVGQRQRRIASTAKAMAEAMESLAQDDERFAGGEGSEGSGGGGGGGGAGGDEGAIPPISELRLLKSLQEQVYLATRALEENRGPEAPDEATRRGELEQLAEMQRSIIDYGNRLLEALDEASSGEVPDPEAGGTPPLGSSALPMEAGGRSSSHSSELGSSARIPVQETSPEPPPSLDDLLGIDEEETEVEDGDAPTDIPSALDDRLRERPIADGFKEALAGMAESEEALADRGDTGLSTQRIQEGVLRNLQALIESARRQRQQQQQQSSGSSGSSSSEPSRSPSGSPSSQSQSSPSTGQDRPSGESGDGSPPGFEQAELGGMLEEGRVEWGRLPERVRELVRQGRRDRISSIYRRLTEQYYRRLAEEAVP